VKGSSSARVTATTKRASKAGHRGEIAQGEEVALGQEVVERLKSWCYV